jgi:glycerophosphoryl diester phosphodiesterase
MKHILNIAHRGLTKTFPDNTLEAFEAAMQIPVDGIECDIHETADHQFVVYHDAELSGENINRLSLAEVGKVKIRDRYQIPTLEQILDLCGGRVRLMLEIKQVQSLERFVKIVTAKVKPSDAIITSFNRDIVLNLSGLVPEIERGILTAFEVKEPVATVEAVRANALVGRCPFVTEELINEVQASNLAVYVWGCPNMEEVRRTLRLDIDGMISDFPDLVASEPGIKCQG